ncbi:MAG TPA: 5-(carboxyamino)imidazole ribonucleotide synthase [Elusimicrobiota bacterium]|nr:5-(carboxyamino)imidazole ribonucleotide synthase [Elusimicrobiota bacterium]
MTPLAPGRTLGILGGGQLGRLIAQAAKKLGYRTAALDAAKDSPALQVVDVPVIGGVDDPEAARRLAQISDVVTLEWELISPAALEAAAALKPLFPAPSVLAVIADRLTQREFLKKHGFPQTEYGAASSAADLPYYPVIVKRRRHGYDGKGQARLSSAEDAAKSAIFEAPCVWEKIVGFEREISVILARGRGGEISVFPIAENLHRAGILHTTRAPGAVSLETAERAVKIARGIADKLGHVGVLAVEMFLLPETEVLLVNEIAPRVHNSGHYTLDACATSQFEQHVRAVCGLPLGDVAMKDTAVMVNLLGDLWEKGEPDWSKLKAIPGLSLHLYGKSSARPGRKMGHYVVVGRGAAGEWLRADERLASVRRR